MKRKKLIWRAAAIVLIFAMALDFVPLFGAFEARAASHKIMEKYVGYYKQYHNGELQMKYRAKMHMLDGKLAYCVHMEKQSDAGAAKEISIKKYLPGNELVMACLARKHIFDMDKYTKAEKYMLTQCMVWFIQRKHIGDGGWRQYVCDIDMSVSKQKKFYSDLEKKVKDEAPAYEGHGTAWRNVDVPDMQEVAVLMAPTLKTGELLLKKVSSGPELVKNNQCYSLSGAEYGIYTDAACTKSAGTLKTDVNGNTGAATLPIGKYYVKETKVSKGYELDPTVYPVTVGFGDKKTLTVKEVPGHVLLNLRLKKLDAETLDAAGQGGASLAGAEFTVCYYDGFFTEEDLPDYDAYESEAKRKWTVKTVEKEEDGGTVYCA